MSPTPHVWIELFAAPALAGAAVFGAAGALAARRLSGRRQRAIWLTAFAALGWFLLGLGMGADRWLRSASVPSAPPVKRAFRVREAPVFLADASLTGEGAPVAPTVSAVAEPAYGWWPAWLWLGGAFLLLGRMGLQRLGWAITTRRARRPGTDALQARVEILARRLGMRRRVRVFVSPELLSPAAWGVWRPVIMTPEDFASAQDERRQDAMLLHELAHLALHDPLWHTAARMVVAALWWHPLAWWGWNRLRAASEAAADEASVLAPDGPSELAAGL
ncbi:MAG: hypothetical protein J7M29_05015, partial [Verrucomicrobia bacterium]|nr:hypothetical protein [Verrucomicrobiota bacterium]